MKGLDWETLEPELRDEWEHKYGRSGLDWWEIREAHRYGWDASTRPEFASKHFADAERDLAQHWYRPQSATEENSWDYVREAVLDGWQSARRRLSARETVG